MIRCNDKTRRTTQKSFLSTPAKASLSAIALAGLSGCLLTSPYWNQEFEDRTDLIPLQAWTNDKDKDIVFECTKAFHGGLYPSAGTADWVHIVTSTPQEQSLKDSFGNKVYGSGKKRVLPESCWRQEPGNGLWYSAVRARPEGSSAEDAFNVFNKTGLKCLGEETGAAASWYGWLNKGCELANSAGDKATYVIFRAKS